MYIRIGKKLAVSDLWLTVTSQGDKSKINMDSLSNIDSWAFYFFERCFFSLPQYMQRKGHEFRFSCIGLNPNYHHLQNYGQK